MREIKGAQFGFALKERGRNDKHIVLQLLTEDDENWFPVGNGFSSFWLKDLIAVAQSTLAVLEAQADRSPDGFGYQFKDSDS